MLIREAYVFINLDGEEVVAGKLQHHRESRGLERFYFVYAQSYLQREQAFSIDPRQLPLREETMVFDELPLAIQDAGPDDFGRLLYERTVGQAQSPLDYQIANSTFGIGALALGISLELPKQSLLIHFDDLEEISDALNLLEQSRPIPEHLENLLHPGSSLPGARPKALLLDEEGNQWIAKFSRENDVFDIQIAETAAMSAAACCGIYVAEHKLLRVANRNVYLSKRFDRQGKLRKHFLSAYTLMGGNKAKSFRYYEDFSYPRLAELCHRVSRLPSEDCQELFSRMLFNALCANKDDHLKNHGFLMTKMPHYCLSPAYDLVPGAGAGEHAIGLGIDGPVATRKNTFSRLEAFKLDTQAALACLEKVAAAVDSIVTRAKDYGLAEEELRVLQQRLQQTRERFFSEQ